MSSSRFRFRRKHHTPKQEVLSSYIRHETSPIIQLNGAHDRINSVIFVEEQNAIVCASDDSSIRVYDRNSDGNPKDVFDNHNSCVKGLAQLDDDLAVSVSFIDHSLLTWRVSDTHQVAKWVPTTALTAVAKLDVSHIVVGDFMGGVSLLYHNNGTALQLKKKRPKNHSHWITCIVVYGSLFVTCSSDKTAIVWDAKSLEPLATLYHKDEVYAVAINDEYIITSTRDKKLHVFDNAPDYNSSQVLLLAKKAYEVQFLDEDIIALACRDGFLDFFSLSQKSYISRCKITDADSLLSFVILPNAQILLGDYEGICSVVTPPEPVLDAVQACVSRLYPSSQTALQHRFPLRAAWDSVQAGSLSLYNACATIITSDNCKRSIDEWCIAHNLLMQAVKSGDIPPSRHFNDIKCHWHLVLYHHCSKLAIGQKDIAYLVTLFNQAEDAGVIATGGAEVLIEIISVRKDIMQDTRLITNAIYKLFLRQAHMDVRLEQLLHYQKVQQLTSLINAIVGCIPVAGGIATNVLSGGASILSDFQVCGLAESLMGVGNDFAAFGYDHLVDRFVSRSTQILSPEEWEELSSEQRRVVEDAADSLGLTVEQLRERLEQVGAMEQSCSEVPAAKVVIEEIEPSGSEGNSGTSATLLSEDNEITITQIHNEDAAACSSGKTSEEDLVSQIQSLKDAGMEKSRIREMDSYEIATTISAFLVLYKASNAKRFAEICDALVEKFDAKSVIGLTFVDADDLMKKIITKNVLNAISTVLDEDDLKLISVPFQAFLDRLA